jgi:hypothetical protein
MEMPCCRDLKRGKMLSFLTGQKCEACEALSENTSVYLNSYVLLGAKRTLIPVSFTLQGGGPSVN